MRWVPGAFVKILETKLDDFLRLYSHPSAAFFRAVEAKALHSMCRKMDFDLPSLDLGCGDGTIASLLFDSRFTYGVDNGEAKDVQTAIDKKIYSKVFIESAEKMTILSESVGFVFSNCVIEHIPNVDAVLREVSRILKPGGRFLFTVPSHLFPDYLYLTNAFLSSGFAQLSRAYKYRRNKMLNQFHCYSVRDWDVLLRGKGLIVEASTYYMPKSGLMLWDKMALEFFFVRLLGKNAASRCFTKYKSAIISQYDHCDVAGENGAGLIICCRKPRG